MSATRIGGFDAPALDPVGRTMAGRYRIGRVLGAGGMGTVHEALDVAMDRPVALKLLRAELARDEHQLARFEREARAVAKLSHPNVVGVTELVRDPTLGMGLVMELLTGKSLATLLEDGPLSESEAVDVMMQALDGLAVAHAAGMVHRDLKPSNVFVVPIANGRLVKLLDFGIVKLAEDGAAAKLTRKGALVGTPTYMSPEQVACAPVDARSDVYSMGACLYEALVAQPPYDGPHALALVAAVGAGPPRDLHEIDEQLSLDLAHVVRVAMSRDPAGRYQSAAAMRDALRGAVIQTGPRLPRVMRGAATPGATREHTLDAAPARVRGRAVAPLAVIVALVALAALAAIALRRRTPDVAPAPPASVALPGPLARPASPTTRAAPPTALAPSVSEAPRTIPRGLEPPPSSAPPAPATAVRAPRPPPPSHPPPTDGPHHGRLGEDVLDPFAP